MSESPFDDDEPDEMPDPGRFDEPIDEEEQVLEEEWSEELDAGDPGFGEQDRVRQEQEWADDAAEGGAFEH